MSLKPFGYEVDEMNVTRMWDIESHRNKHLRQLQTIYRDKDRYRHTAQKEHIQRQIQLDKIQQTKQNNYQRRNKSFQEKINYENAILRNKILDTYYKPSTSRKMTTFVSTEDREKTTIKTKLFQNNLRFKDRLKQIKSEVKNVCNNPEHQNKQQKLLGMLRKKSPERKMYLQSLAKKQTRCFYFSESMDINVG